MVYTVMWPVHFETGLPWDALGATESGLMPAEPCFLHLLLRFLDSSLQRLPILPT